MHDGQERRTIVAVATPQGKSALAMIRISGPQSVAITVRLTKIGNRLQSATSHTFHYTTIIDPARNIPIDTVVVLLYRAPHSYTGEEAVELCCHGNPAIIEDIVDLYQRYGAEPAEPGEFTMQAMMNGRLDLTQAEAVEEVITAEGRRAREVALSHLNGDLRNEIETIKQHLVHTAAGINIQLDYPIEESGELTIDNMAIATSRAALQRLIASYRVGRLLCDGIVVVLMGKVNSGKSSLFNRLLREERAIVSHHAGTTRDYLEGRVEVDGLPLRLFDTAGLRETAHEIEQEGIVRTRQLIDGAELLLYIVDGSIGLTDEDWQELDQLTVAIKTKAGARIAIVYNKSDLITDDPLTIPLPRPPSAIQSDAASAIAIVRVSAKTGAGMAKLTELLAHSVAAQQQGVETGEAGAIISSKRQMLILTRAEEALKHAEEQLAAAMPIDMIALDIEEAIRALGQITGEVTTADMLHEMFSNFCVGK